MPRPDDCTLTSHQRIRVRKEAERALIQAGVLGVLPTPVEEIMRAARVREVEEDILNPSFMKRLMGKVGRTGEVLKRALSKVIGLFHAADGIIFIDQTLHQLKQRFVRFHESAHGFLPWQRPMYALVQDSDEALDPGTADLFDREANTFASEVLFQLDAFRDRAAGEEFSIFTPVKLARKFNASVYASVRQYVSKNHRTCVVLVLDMPVLVIGEGFRASLRRAVPSESFRQMFARQAWPEVFTPDDQLGQLVPINGRRASRRRSIGLYDDNGTLHDCTAEAFSSGHNVFILIAATNAITRRIIV